MKVAKMMKQENSLFRNKLVLITIIAIVSIFMGRWNFELPGIHMDEANHAAFAVGILNEEAARLHHYRLPDNYFDLTDQHYRYPILGGSFYNTVVTAYLGLPVYKIFGFSFESLRLVHGGIGFLCVVLGALFLVRVVGYPAAYFFAALVTTNPDFVFSLRSQAAIFWPVVLFALVAGFSFSIAEAAETLKRKKWFLFLTGCCLSWAVASYFVGVFIVLPALLFIGYRLKNSVAELSVLCLGLFLGYLPVLYALTSVYLVNPLSLNTYGMPEFALRDKTPIFNYDNFERVIRLFHRNVSEFVFTKSVVGNFIEPMNVLRMFSWLAVVVIAFLSICRVKGLAYFRRTLQLSLVILFSFAIGAFFLKSMRAHHMLPIIFVLAIQASLLLSRQNFVKYIIVFVGCIILAGNVQVLTLSHAKLEESGGRKYHNETYSSVADVLKDECDDCHPVFISWGYHLSYLFLTQGSKKYAFLPSSNLQKVKDLTYQYGQIAVIGSTDDLDPSEFLAEEVQHVKTLNMQQRNGRPLFNIHFLKVPKPKLDVLSSLSLEVIKWGPRTAPQATVPNIQPNGDAGIWVLVKADKEIGELEVLINGVPSMRTRVADDVVTALVKAEAFSDPSAKTIEIRQVLTGKLFPVGVFEAASQ